MEIARDFPRGVFSPAVVREAITRFREIGNTEGLQVHTRRVRVGQDALSFDSDEEFRSAFGQAFRSASYSARIGDGSFELYTERHANEDWGQTTVTVRLPERAEIDQVLNIFEDHADESRIVPTQMARPVVFIGHGHSSAWRDLKDHLHEQHGYAVETDETGARAGHTIRDILSSMSARSSFAVLVMTADDRQPDGSYRARENVVHEGRLVPGRPGI